MRRINGMSVFETPEEVLAPAHTALLVIDMQNDLLSDEGAYARRGEDARLVRAAIEPVARLVRAARDAGVLVVYTQNTTLPGGRSDSPAWTYFKHYSRPELAGQYTLDGTWGHEIVPELAPGDGDVVIRKHRSDGFVGTDLDLVLRSNGVRSVATAGIVTNGCVESTVRHAAFLDYYSVVVGDACASTSPRLHDAAIELLRGRHDILTVDTVTAIWGARP
ncbi:isochorismatase [Sphaerisporangium rufum]|uniref:Isochorismatase n=1 Tax=Sphaerisporangium rufum TaxID=1381558 RepID=A0A919QXL4_9ACTN|nr:isochorismatase family cysteine hydrolase [Sphaerisporangium rufum]GII75999.1 isochorismatase [Sphaerisporangium rufum]